MNNKPVDRTKKSNIKCEHCKHWDKKWCVCTLTNEDKNYWNRCKKFEWAESEDKKARINMQIVIDIPEEDWRFLKESDGCRWSRAILDGVINGTPLPKGHGKIVDIDKLIDRKCNECGHLRGVSCTIPCREVRRMLGADTIIEADKKGETQ